MRLFYFLLFTTLFLSAQNQQYSLSSINSELLEDADAVVRLDKMMITVEAYNAMEVSSRRVVTVLNENGQKHVDAYAFYDDNSKIKTLSAFVYDSQGKEIKKIKEKDFIDQSASGDGTLYSDSRVKFLRYTPVSYPYTIVFEKTYTTADTAFLPHWYFLDGYRVSTEKSEFIFDLKTKIPLRKKEQNLEDYAISVESVGNKLKYTAENLKAIEGENYSPEFYDFAPSIKLALERFHLKGVDGQAKNWSDYGKWIYNSLLRGQAELNLSTINGVKSLVAGIEDPKKKVEKIYEYVQNNTRYISVQLGIGGWMPISAEEVNRVKYGDCKGLTNYTMALLKAVGINSYYTVVYADADQRSLDAEFPSLQGNHVFLNVPLNDKELWLECTSQIVPADYLGTFTDNRYVLKVTPDGGELVKSRAYENKDNWQLTKADITISEENGVQANVEIVSSGTQYNQKFRLPLKDEQEKESHYKEYWDYVNDINLTKISFENDKDNIELKEKVSLSSNSYLSKAGDKVLFAPNMLNRNLFVPKRYRNRRHDVIIKRGYLDEDEFTIALPDDFKVESLISSVNLKTEFGEYTISMEKIAENRLIYKRRLLIKSGKYSKDSYEDFRNFRKKIARSDNSKIVLIKA
ncbi:DUF3857 domain-containing protein [Croceitalea vernalis]|uniref:DUF3857 domain-containing protein n=1 Tax=Croceitalea vernalis TaxID=3075599 RepID=A0ABU3BG47_9FLAO|nr:DUF3857 domain-containing protein [Croceitalea sp. P007]MDT0621148.1 DUF3857 domain-containing protein [Croceitalea sp. P007]